MVSKSWKLLDKSERSKWEKMAREDKVRYEREKASYKGPWKVPNVKFEYGPKKPMSAFLAFGNERRGVIAESNPRLSNAEISSLLSKLWRECPADIKKAYRDREAREREAFKKNRAAWERIKRREAGIDLPNSQSPTSAEEEMMEIDVKNLALPDDFLYNGCTDDWDSWTSSSDLDSADTAMMHPKTNEHKKTNEDTPSSMPNVPLLRSIAFSCKLFLPKLLGHARKTIADYSLDDLLADEELFEDFSPQDAPTTAPFINAALPSDRDTSLSDVMSL